MYPRLAFVFLLLSIASCSSEKVKDNSVSRPSYSGDCKKFKLKDQGTGINLSFKKELDFGITAVNNKRFKTLEFYTRDETVRAENLTGNIYEPPFSFGHAFPGISPQYYGCQTNVPPIDNAGRRFCLINLEFVPSTDRHYMSTFVLTYYLNGAQCSQLITLRGQGVIVR